MAINVREERIELTAVDKFSGVFKSAQGHVLNLGAGLDTVRNAMAAVGVTVGVGAMLALAKDTLAAVAALDDMAESTGASVEMLSAIQRVAKVGGHDFEGLTAQIGKTIKGLKENNEEGGKAARALDFLGVKAKDGSGRFRDMGEVMIEVARALDKYQDGGNKVALVQDVLGKGAERYIPLLKDIAEGTDLVVTTTARQAEEADKAEKAMRRVGVAMEDSRRVLVNQYSPALTEFLEQLSTGIRLFGGFGSALYNIGFGIDPFKSLTENLRLLNEQIEEAEEKRASRARGRPSESDVDTLRKRREFVQFQLRQQALGLVSESNLDVRDLQARGAGREALTYQSPGEGDSKALRAAEFRAQKQVELEEMAAADSREAWDIYTKGRLAQEAELRKGQEQMMKDWFELIDQEQADAVARGQEYLDSEQNRTREFYNAQHNELVRARDLGILTQSEYNEREAELSYDHQRRLSGITTIGLTEREKFQRMSSIMQAQTIFGELANITAGVSQHNKALFQINKVAGIANAIINAHIGISKTLSTYPYPWNLALAALHGVAAFAQVSAISSSSFGGGGGAAPSIAGSTAATPVSPVTSGAPGQRGPDTIINIRGDDVFSGRTVAMLAERFNEFTRDGGRVVVSQS